MIFSEVAFQIVLGKNKKTSSGDPPGGAVGAVGTHIGSLFHDEKITSFLGLAFYKGR